MRVRGAHAIRRGLVVAVVTGVLVVTSGPALAQSVDGRQRATIITAGPLGTPSKAVLAGVVTGVGTSTNSETSGTIVLRHGTISVSHPPSRVNDVFHPGTCTLWLDEAGPYEFTGGTGRYAGISGHGTFTVKGVVFFGRTGKGCAQVPSSEFVLVQTVGTTRLGKA